MSGGHFEYKQFHLDDIIEDLQSLIHVSEKEEEYGYSRSYPDDVIVFMKMAITRLQEAKALVHRIDCLVCGYDGLDSFRKRLLEKIK